MYALLEKDEEADSSVYAAYLRAQNDDDLLDIARHLDPERYPARADAVRRETDRRRVLSVPAYSLEERIVRGLCVAGWLYAAAVLLLTLLLTSSDADGPRWVDLAHVPNGTSAAELMRQTLLGLLRATVVDGTQMALPILLLLGLAGWLLTRFLIQRVRAEVKWDALVTVVGLCAVFCLAAAPFSHVPSLAGLSSGGGSFQDRLVTLFTP